MNTVERADEEAVGDEVDVEDMLALLDELGLARTFSCRTIDLPLAKVMVTGIFSGNSVDGTVISSKFPLSLSQGTDGSDVTAVGVSPPTSAA